MKRGAVFLLLFVAGHAAEPVPVRLPPLPSVTPRGPVVRMPVEHPQALLLSKPMRPLPLMCGGVIFPPSRGADGLIDLFGSGEDYIRARWADALEIALLHRTGETYAEGSRLRLSPRDAGTVAGTLTCDAAWDWENRYHDDLGESGPVYRFRLFFYSGQEIVVLDLCPEQMRARVMKGQREVGTQSFAGSYAVIADVLERLFPLGFVRNL